MPDDRPPDEADTKQQPTLQELERLRGLLATLIDFDQLVAEGVLVRRGDWWEVLDMGRLPEHARVKIQAVEGSLVKFAAPAGMRKRKK